LVSPMTSTLPASTTPSILASSWLTTESRTCRMKPNDARLQASWVRRVTGWVRRVAGGVRRVTGWVRV
jgi:hypothetical protein